MPIWPIPISMPPIHTKNSERAIVLLQAKQNSQQYANTSRTPYLYDQGNIISTNYGAKRGGNRPPPAKSRPLFCRYLSAPKGTTKKRVKKKKEKKVRYNIYKSSPPAQVVFEREKIKIKRP